MTTAVALALLLSLAPPVHPAPAAPAADEALYRTGAAFADFVDAARSRQKTWRGNYARAHAPAELRRRLAAVRGQWHLLVVAEAWCLDSANTVPYLARLAEQAPNVDLRIVDSTVGRAVMDAHRTADGRPATPTIVVLDARFREAGAFVERPAPLAAWFARTAPGISSAELHARLSSWYNWDRGDTTMAEVVGLIESAAGRASR